MSKTQIKKLKVGAIKERKSSNGGPFLKCWTNDGVYFCFSESGMEEIRKNRWDWAEYVTRESNGFKNIQGLKPAETREEAWENMKSR